MKNRMWKSMAAWILIAVLCAGSIQVSASGIQGTETGETKTEDVTDPVDATDTNDATDPVDTTVPADTADTTEDPTLPTSSEETYEAAAPRRKLRAPAANQDVVMPNYVTIVYGQKFEEAEKILNETIEDGSFFLYEYNSSIQTKQEARMNSCSNDAQKYIGEVTRYGVWFVPADGSEGWGQPITVNFLPKPITVVIDDRNITYGETALYTYGDIEWAFGDDYDYPEKLKITLTAKDAAGNPVTESTPVGTYTITGTYTSTCYDVTFQEGKLTIEPKEAELSWSGYETRTYNPDRSSNVTASVSNLINGDTCSVTVENGTNKNAGKYTAVAAGLSNPNYMLPTGSNLRRDYTIEKATPGYKNVTAALTYGQTLAEAKTQGTATDPTNGNAVPGSFVFNSGGTLPVVADSGTTKYSMTFRPKDATNYHEVSITQYQLTVSKKPLAVQIRNVEKIYGDELSADAFVSYDPSELSGTDELKIPLTATDESGTTETLDPTYIGAGTYTIRADPDTLDTENSNYDITVRKGSLTVQKRPVILKWSDVSNIVHQHVNGVENPSEWAKVGANVTASVENLVSKDGTPDDCRVVVTGGDEKTPSSGRARAAEFTIYYAVAEGLEGTASSNYTLQGELPEGFPDITEACQNSRLKPYVIREKSEDCIFPAVMVMTYGELFQDARMLAGSGAGTFTIVDENDQPLTEQKLNAGTYSDTYKVKFTSSDGSKVNYGTSTLIMQKAPLTVTAENASKIYGEGRPDYTWTVTEGTLVEGDDLKELLTVRSVLSGQEEEGEGNPAGAGAASGDETTSPVNVYDIVLDQQLNNYYDLTFVGSKLTVHPKEIEIVWSDASHIVYGYVDGEKNPEKWRKVGANVTAEAKGLVNGDICNLTCSGGNGTNAGKYQAGITGLDNPNYCLPSSGKTLKYEILKADPEAVFPNELNAYKGNTLGSLSFEAGADVPGTFAFDAADAVLEKSGSYKMIFTPDDLQNYNAAEAMVKVTVSERTDDGDGGTDSDDGGSSGSHRRGSAGSNDRDGAGVNGADGAAARNATGADTSDNNPILLYSIFALLSFSSIVIMVLRKKRHQK